MKNITVLNLFTFLARLRRVFENKNSRASKVMVCLPSGKYVSSNTRALLTYLNDQNPDFAVIAYKSDGSLRSDIKLLFPNVESVALMSAKGIKTFAKTMCILISNGSFDHFPFKKLPHQTVVNMWHSMPMKDISSTDKSKDWDFAIVSSQKEKTIFEQSFSLAPEQVKVLGIPKTDRLFKVKKDTTSKSILYVPTFRGEKGTDLFPFTDFDVHKLESFLEKHDLYINVKFHVNEQNQTLPGNKGASSRIRLLPTMIDIEQAIIECRLLITDYSGIFYDALAMDIPMLFIPYDIDEYRETRGFILDYNKYTPGPKVLTQSNFINAIEEVVENRDGYVVAREEMRSLFFQFQDGGNIERLIDFLSIKNRS